MAHWKPVDQIQDLVNKMGGEKEVNRFLSGELTLVPRDPQALLVPVGEPITLPAITKFLAKDAFTKANGIVWAGDNFREFILPLVEENIPEAIVQVSELARDARDLAIAAELKVHINGELALAHFFQAIQDSVGIRTDGHANMAYIIGTDGETWAVDAYLRGVAWRVHAHRLGFRYRWDAGRRFLSR